MNTSYPTDYSSSYPATYPAPQSVPQQGQVLTRALRPTTASHPQAPYAPEPQKEQYYDVGIQQVAPVAQQVSPLAPSPSRSSRFPLPASRTSISSGML